jgi:hypothetical protein
MLLVLCLCLGAFAFAADTVKVVVGHQCCAACVTALVEGVKETAWVDTVNVTDTTATITPKADQAVEFVSLWDNLRKAGFPPKDIPIAAPITLTIGHLCCGACVAGLKKALDTKAITNLDRTSIAIDMGTQTVTLKPLDGKTMNLVQLVYQMEQGGFSATKIVYLKR